MLPPPGREPHAGLPGRRGPLALREPRALARRRRLRIVRVRRGPGRIERGLVVGDEVLLRPAPVAQ